MPQEYIEIDSGSDDGLSANKSRPPLLPPAKNTTRFTAVAAVSSSFGSNDIAWDTLDDGWIDKILKEGAAAAAGGYVTSNAPIACHSGANNTYHAWTSSLGSQNGGVVDLSASRTPSPVRARPSFPPVASSSRHAQDHLAQILGIASNGLSSSPVNMDSTLQALLAGNSRNVGNGKGKQRATYETPAAVPLKQVQPQRPPPTQSSQIDVFTSPSIVPPPKIRVSSAEVEIVEIADSPIASTRTHNVLALAGPSIQPNGLLADKSSRSRKSSTSEDDDTDEDGYALDFTGVKRDKGKRRADDVVDKADLFEALYGDVVRPVNPLKRTRTSVDGLSPPSHNRLLGATRSLSVLPGAGASLLAGTNAPTTAAEKKAESARLKKIKVTQAERIKAEKALEKEREKRRVLAEREARKKDIEVNRLRASKSETVREVTVHISPELENRGSPIATAIPLLRERLAEKESSMSLLPVPDPDDPAQRDQVDGSTLHVPGLVKVKRWITAEFDTEKRRFVAVNDGEEYWQDQLPYVIIITAKELVEKMVAGKYDKSKGLVAWLSSMKRKLGLTRSATDTYANTPIGAAPASTPGSQTSRCEIMLMIHGMKAYYSKTNGAKSKEFAEKVRSHMTGQAVPRVSSDAVGRSAGESSGETNVPDKEEVEKELVKLQLIHRCFQVCVENKMDSMEWLYNIAGDIAIRPREQNVEISKSFLPNSQIQNSHLPFSTRDVPKKGDGPFSTFKLILEEITGVTESGAEGIAEQWKSFRNLMEAYEHMERRKQKGEIGQKEIEHMLSTCVVKALTTGVANARPLGMAVSKHVYKAFRGKDPESIDN
ncbi:hypothetical protein QFC21_004767 [Naganishia friedmannii]|uniref:Uncharacterized protein n=1 Tax=Naganishia friedmannii TaxID=89922 RepID=A0ACC2VEY8_9TREE|nr:hypothetical protein QFC21_004767 [Naganishia friedmannii]